jgi:hypothetical protein
LQPEPAMCGEQRSHAMIFLAQLEALTQPG